MSIETSDGHLSLFYDMFCCDVIQLMTDEKDMGLVHMMELKIVKHYHGHSMFGSKCHVLTNCLTSSNLSASFLPSFACILFLILVCQQRTMFLVDHFVCNDQDQ